MSTHTPAPWTHDRYGVRNRGGYICAIHWPHRYEYQDERYAEETAERERDVRLIVASPKLLAACKAIDTFYVFFDSLTPPELGSGAREALQMVRDAIAEVEAAK